MKHAGYRKKIRSFLIFVTSLVVVMAIVSFVEAGSLIPPTPPSETSDDMKDLDAIYNALAGDSFDSSSQASKSYGNALQISRCILEKMRGGDC